MIKIYRWSGTIYNTIIRSSFNSKLCLHTKTFAASMSVAHDANPNFSLNITILVYSNRTAGGSSDEDLVFWLC
jgi:hypothetical protein